MKDNDTSIIDRKSFSKSFVQRLPWEALKDVLNANGLIRSTSREKTADIIFSALNSSTDESSKLLDTLLNIYIENIYYGDKAVRFFNISDDKLNQLIEYIPTYEPRTNIFSDNFPLPLSSDELREHHKKYGLTPSPIKVQRFDNKWIILFASSRYYTQQDKFNSEQLEEKKLDFFSNYNEVIAKRNIYRQAFDFITINIESNMIQVGIDHPYSGGAFSQTLEQKDNAFTIIIKSFNELTHHLIPGKTMLPESAMVLFSAINNFYHSTDGRIIRMRFLTSDGLDDHAHMRNIRLDDYRENRFHKGGKAKVDHLTPYRISMAWTREIANAMKSYPLLHLQGTKPMLNTPKRRLKEAFVSNTIGKDDYKFVVNKLFSYISST